MKKKTEYISGPEDNEIVEGIKRGDERSLEQLSQNYRLLLLKIINQAVFFPVDAEQIFNDLLMEVWRKIKYYDPNKGKLLGWLIRMARRRAIDYYRSARVRECVLERLEKEERQNAKVSYRQDQTLSKGECFVRLRELVRLRLPEAQAECLELSFFSELSERQIAAKLNLPLGTVKTRLELGLKKIGRAAKVDAIILESRN